MKEDQMKILLQNLHNTISNWNDSTQYSPNIIQVLHREDDEVRLHSRFISFLLSPKGSHNMQEFFLNSFLNYFELNIFHEVDLKTIEVYPNEINKKEYYDIDILLISKLHKKAIIIENKIYAGESNHDDRGQIEGYFNKVRDEFKIDPKNIKVLYLSPSGKEPSEISLGKYKKLENVNGKAISYKKDVIEWLDQLQINRKTESNNNEFLFECISQYQAVVKTLTNYINMENLKEIISVITKSDEQIKAAKVLMNNFDNIKHLTLNSFWDGLKGELKKYPVDNISMGTSEYEITFHYKGDKFFIYHENNLEESLYWGFYKKSENVIKGSDINKFIEKDTYYMKFFMPAIHLLDFNNQRTFNLISEGKRQSVIGEIIKELKSCLNLQNH